MIEGQVVTLLLLVCVHLAQTHTHNYTGHAIVRAWPRQTEHLTLLRDLPQQHKVQFWREPHDIDDPVDLMVSPEHLTSLITNLNDTNLEYTINMPDIQKVIDVERRSIYSQKNHHRLNVSTYNTYEQIITWMADFSQRCGPMCETIKIGTSVEGRDLTVIRLGTPHENKPIIWIDAGMHAREWIAPATAIYLIDKLGNPSHPPDMYVRYLLHQFTWYILPLANPDGYDYTWTTDRLWRKNRSQHSTNDCAGVDLNRNWAFHWGDPGTSNNPCDENYRGTSAFSEPESRAISTFLDGLSDRLVIYLSLHSYGQYWLTPWGFTYHLPDDYNDLIAVGRRVVYAINSQSGAYYRLGASSRLLYLAPGGADDYVKGVLGVKYSFTVELKDTGQYGFMLPPRYIQGSGEDMFTAIRTLAHHVVAETRHNP